MSKKQKTTNEPALVTPEDLAGHYGVAKSTVLEWYHKGLIPAEVAVGKVYRFDAARVADALRKAAERNPRGERKPLDRMPLI